jgi:hypothetical protein
MDIPASTDGFGETRFYAYESKLSKHAVDMSAVEADLEEALRALTIFVEVESEVPEKQRVTSFALWTYAIMMYARVFAKGRRPWVNEQLSAVVTAEPKAQEVHDHILGVRNKHVAHSVSDMERSRTTIEVGTAPNGNVRMKASSISVSLGGPAGPGIAEDFKILVQLLLAEVQKATRVVWDLVNEEAFSKYPTSNDVMTLPEVTSITVPGPSAWRRSRR